MTSTTTNESAFTFLQQGALIQEFRVAGKNIVLGFPNAALYKTHNTPFFGETIGRVANRISGAEIKTLNGKSYKLAANNGPNTLHGGNVGWGKKIFQGPRLELRDEKETTVYTLRSEDGDEGYPGTVDVEVAYTAFTEAEDGVEKIVLNIDYEVKMADEQPEGVEETTINLTNHSYFNIGPGPTIEGTVTTLPTTTHLPLTSTGIPIGHQAPYPGLTPNEPFTLGASEPDVDDCFLLNADPATVPLDTRPLPALLAAKFHHPGTGITLEISTTEPAFQFYTAKYISVSSVDGGPAYGPRSGFCIEPGRYVNAINVDEWRGMTVLKQGDVYGARIVYKAWKQ